MKLPFGIKLPTGVSLSLLTRQLRAHLRYVVVVVAGLVLVNLLFMVVVNRPRLEKARTADEVTARLAGLVERAQDRVERLESTINVLQDNKQALEQFIAEGLSTKRERLVAVQREIHRIAKTFQVQPTQLKFSHESVTGTNLDRLEVTLPLSGGYNNLRQFIVHVEKSQLFLIIESIQIQEGERGGAMLNLSIRLATYFTRTDTSDLTYKLES